MWPAQPLQGRQQLAYSMTRDALTDGNHDYCPADTPQANTLLKPQQKNQACLLQVE